MSEAELKYLDLLQDAINRMAANSFLLKGWSVTLGTTVLGFSVKEENWMLALFAVIPVLSFWLLDAYYLGLERLFRELWKKAVKAEVEIFEMNPGKLSWQLWVETAWRPAVWMVHLPTIVVSLLTAAALEFFFMPNSI
jgi:hypothetical protein